MTDNNTPLLFHDNVFVKEDFHNKKIFQNHINEHLERLKKGQGDDCEIDKMTVDDVNNAGMWTIDTREPISLEGS